MDSHSCKINASTSWSVDAEKGILSDSDTLPTDGGMNPSSSTQPDPAKQAEDVASESKSPPMCFELNDPEDPKNFSPLQKAWITGIMSVMALSGSMGSSIIAPAEPVIADYLGLGLEPAVLILALFVLGYALGPLLWAPISEVYGRRWSMIPPVFVLGILSIGTAVSKSVGSVLVTRFLGGVFGSAPISNVSAALGDFYHPSTRGIAMIFASVCIVGGPTLAPVIGAAITVNPHLGWRWTEYMQAIMTFVIWAAAAFGMPETYGPVLLKRKAERLRKETGDSKYWHPHENEKMRPRNILSKYLSRPLRFLFTEPIVSCMALYASFVYGLLFLTLQVFPIVFSEQRKYPLVVSTLPFLAQFVGVICAIGVNLANQPRYIKAVKENGGRAVPEARLPPMMVGGVCFSAGLFWFGWTAAPEYNVALPIVAAAFIGAGFNIVFQQCLNFLVDSYGPYGASAVSANTFLRSILACALPLAARPMFLNLGVGPASSVLGGISCLALPAPLLLKRYGSRLRSMSKFAQKD